MQQGSKVRVQGVGYGVVTHVAEDYIAIRLDRSGKLTVESRKLVKEVSSK